MTDTQTPSAEQGVDEAIRQKITGKSVGCGCIGALVVAVFGAYYMSRVWSESPDFALIVTGLVGVTLFVASWMRGYHVLTGAATLSMLSMSAGAAPLLSRVIFPDLELYFLPSLMRSWWLPILLIVAPAGLLAFLMLKMKDTISTPEALYSIQVAAATKNVPAETHGEFVGAAFGLLESCGKSGAWPVDGSLISGDTNLSEREEHDPLLKILVIRVRPQEEPKEGSDWQWQKLGSPPWLQKPDTWFSAFPNLGPLSVGELVVEPGALKYLPLRTGKPITLPVDELDEVRIALNSFELRKGDERLAFTGMHVWRALSLLSYLRGMHTRWDHKAGVIRGLAPKDASIDWPEVPTPAQLSDRLVDLSSEAWSRRVARHVRPLATGDRVERVLAGHLCTACELLSDDPDAAVEAIDEASGLLTALPVSVSGIELHAVSADLRGAAWVWTEEWDALEALIPQLDPWDEDDNEDEFADEDDEEDAHRGLMILAKAVAAAGNEEAVELPEEVPGFSDSALVEALREWAVIAPDTPPEDP